MLLGNFIVFVIIIGVICSVDLSQITLDKTTERLLYSDIEDSEQDKDRETVDSKTMESENNVTEDDDTDKTMNSSNGDIQSSLDDLAESLGVEPNVGISADFDDDDDDVEGITDEGKFADELFDADEFIKNIKEKGGVFK